MIGLLKNAVSLFAIPLICDDLENGISILKYEMLSVLLD